MSTSPVASPSVIKKHKKHKSEKREKQEEKSTGLKLILKVGSQTTPEHVPEYGGPSSTALTPLVGVSGETVTEIGGDQQMQVDTNDPHFCMGLSRSHHKKSKKKKKKKDKNKDREKKHKHHHKDKKRKREDNEENGMSLSKNI